MPFQLAGILWLLFFTQVSAQSPASKEYSPPGKLIVVGGRKLHLYCTGTGSPTVILMAGGGAFSIDWALVQPKVAQSTRVCSYDRAGLAWSDPGPADETVEQTISDLHVLLKNGGEKGPFVLVGAHQFDEERFTEDGVAARPRRHRARLLPRLVRGASLV